MKNVLIYDDILSGHHQEYLTHLYNGANSIKSKDVSFIFVVPQTIKQTDNILNRNFNNNISIDYLSSEEIIKTESKWYLISSLNKSIILRKYIKKHNVDEVFLVTLCHPMPLLPLFMPHGVKVSGIIYRIYFYEYNKLRFIRKIKDYIENLVIAKSDVIDTPYVLNDNSATCYYNHFFKTNKFRKLVDPILPLSTEPQNLKNELSILPCENTFLHFGYMTKRKGTIKILDALLLCKNYKNKVFIFAGIVGDDIKSEFYSKISELINKGVKIIIFDEFCSYEKLCNLCYTADCIIIPYSNISYSSGVIGYASLFNKTIIGPKFGLPGKLISRNKIGITIDTNKVKSIALAIDSFKFKNDESTSKYNEINSVINFTKQIYNKYIFENNQ